MADDPKISFDTIKAQEPRGRGAGPYAALIISLIYMVMGLAWIAASDRVLTMMVTNPELLTLFQTVKGWTFVLITAVLLYLLVRGYIGSMEREKDRMQQRLEGIASQYQVLFQHSPSAMLIYDLKTLQFLAANDASLLLFGYTRKEMLAMTSYDLLVEEDRPRAAAYTATSPPTPQNSGIWHCRRRDRRVIFVEAITAQVEFEGSVRGITLTTDVTERFLSERALNQYRSQLEQRVSDRTTELSLANRKLRAEVDERHRIEAELRAATAAAETANAAKSSFLANTSHEIRTPLTSILGYSDLLADDSLPLGDRAKYLEVLQQNAKHLLTLIDDLLDLSRAEMGKVRVIFDDHSPGEIAAQAIELLRPRAVEKLLELKLGYSGEIPDLVRTDGMRLRQVLLNLLSNAVKFTPFGSVSLSVAVVLENDAKVLRFDVADTGIGMDAEHLERIFEPFYQVEHRKFGGSGLGLAISQQLAHLMGGTLKATSTPGKGSVFTLELPLGISSAPMAAPDARPVSAGGILGTILLAEDNSNIRLLVDEYLRRAGAKVIGVPDGGEAVERVKAFLSGGGERIDLVLLDLHMPVLDGADAMRQIRGAGFPGPIVGLTADYAEKSMDDWLRDGWDAMAAKPIDRPTFIPLLSRMLSEWEK